MRLRRAGRPKASDAATPALLLRTSPGVESPALKGDPHAPLPFRRRPRPSRVPGSRRLPHGEPPRHRRDRRAGGDPLRLPVLGQPGGLRRLPGRGGRHPGLHLRVQRPRPRLQHHEPLPDRGRRGAGLQRDHGQRLLEESGRREVLLGPRPGLLEERLRERGPRGPRPRLLPEPQRSAPGDGAAGQGAARRPGPPPPPAPHRRGADRRDLVPAGPGRRPLPDRPPLHALGAGLHAGLRLARRQPRALRLGRRLGGPLPRGVGGRRAASSPRPRTRPRRGASAISPRSSPTIRKEEGSPSATPGSSIPRRKRSCRIRP